MTSLAGARIVVTGGAGFIGSHLVDELVNRRRATRVTIVDSFANGRRANVLRWASDPRVRIVEADIRTEAGLGTVDDADVVFHLACLSARQAAQDPVENHDVNATATLGLVERARTAHVQRFVHVSTSDVFGSSQRTRVDERHPTRPATAYGASKLAGEAYVRAAHREHGLPTTVVRPFSAYGPRSHFEGDSGEMLPLTILRNLCGLPALVPGDGRQTRDFMHVMDLARGLATIAECDAAIGRSVNLGSGREISLGALAETVARLVGRPDLVPLHIDPRPGEAKHLVGDGRLVHKLTGFTAAMPFEAGVADLVRWFRGRLSTPQQILARLERRERVAGRSILPGFAAGGQFA
ncbi:NAD-dependent epimerase/dehydratase family protein [Microbacterium sp.]|uniref:dTDP-glucose 4,6-dehydratase n=1 Tax=Microbacterium sp. TaxID=51671 RepID=UPI002811A114|nr:NAD-dependent epimerase/dehydratase family protein [Microbacterium sp.]